MTKSQTQKIEERAEQILGISLVSIGNRRAYYADETRTWYWVTVSDLRHAVAVAEAHETDVYSNWCAETSVREVSERTIRREGL